MRFNIGIICAALLLAACSGGSGTNAAAAPQSVAEALAAGEASGTLPKLDHGDSVAGPDVDGDGVRDDIDAYIASLPDTPQQKAALGQASAALTIAMTVDPTNDGQVTQALKSISDASACLYQRFAPATASEMHSDMQKLTVNTKNRFDAYVAFNRAANGHTMLAPQDGGCRE